MTSMNTEQIGTGTSAADQLAFVQSNAFKAPGPKQLSPTRRVIDSAMIAIVGYSEAMILEHPFLTALMQELHVWQYGLIASNTLVLLLPKPYLQPALVRLNSVKVPSPFESQWFCLSASSGFFALTETQQRALADPPDVPEPIPRYDIPRLFQPSHGQTVARLTHESNVALNDIKRQVNDSTTALSQRAQMVESSLAAVGNLVNTYEATLAQFSPEKDPITALEAVLQTIKELPTQLRVAGANFDEVGGQIDDLRTRSHAHGQLISDLTVRREADEGELKQLNDRLASLKLRDDEYQQRLDSLARTVQSQQVESLKNTCSTLGKNLSGLNKTVTSVRSELDSLGQYTKHRLDHVREQCAQSQTRLDNFLDQLERLRSDYSELKNKTEALKEHPVSQSVAEPAPEPTEPAVDSIRSPPSLACLPAPAHHAGTDSSGAPASLAHGISASAPAQILAHAVASEASFHLWRAEIARAGWHFRVTQVPECVQGNPPLEAWRIRSVQRDPRDRLISREGVVALVNWALGSHWAKEVVKATVQPTAYRHGYGNDFPGEKCDIDIYFETQLMYVAFYKSAAKANAVSLIQQYDSLLWQREKEWEQAG